MSEYKINSHIFNRIFHEKFFHSGIIIENNFYKTEVNSNNRTSVKSEYKNIAHSLFGNYFHLNRNCEKFFQAAGMSEHKNYSHSICENFFHL